MRYALRVVILSFDDRAAAKVFAGEHVVRFGPDLYTGARKKLLILDAALTLGDLAAVPGNRLEPLEGDREGQHSIRINQQWRVCFTWTTAGPINVEIVDYH